MAYRNVNASTPFDVAGATSASAAGATTYTPTGVTTVTNNATALSIVMENDSSSSIPTPSLGTAQGFTQRFSNGVATSTSNAGSLADKSIATAGAVTFPTWSTGTAVAGHSVWVGISTAIRP